MKFITHKRIHSKYGLLIENAQEIIILFDAIGRIVDCSSASKVELGYGDDISGLPIHEVFKNVFLYKDGKIHITDKYLKEVQEATAYRKNQTCFPVKLKAAVIHEKRKFIGICTATNVTEKREAVQKINNLKNDLNNFHHISSELVARIAHELRTPVNGVMGFSNNLLDMKLTPEQKDAVNIIKRCCNNMNTIINDLLDFAKISNNKLVIEQREFSFFNLIKNIIDVNIIHVNEKGLKLLVNISNYIPDRVIGDEHRLAQILNNLFSNAIKFTAVGQITLEVIEEYQTEQFVDLFFMMIDTGIGISREEKDKLFKSFSQVDSSITRRFGGTGLGLSICKKLVEAMNGTIEVDSEKNVGSTFSFTVRLGLPQTGEKNSFTINDKENLEYQINKVDNKDESNISDMDYISRALNVFNHEEYDISLDSMNKAKNIMNELFEKLTICIAMENWEKSEELACSMKNLIPKDYVENSKAILRLLIAIRKENKDLSLSILNEYKASMLKEK